MLIFSLVEKSVFLIVYLNYSSASNAVIHELKLCLERQGSDTSSIFVERNITSVIYNSLNYQWNTAIPEILPLAYIVPTSTRDVQNAIRCGREKNIRMFAKSGGHSYAKYSFGDSHSVVVDLRKLSKIQVNQLNKTASVGGGALIGKIYAELWRNGKFGIPSTSCTTVGIGGATLGGGYGFWSKRFGLTSDSVIEMDFVDAKGDHLKVNKENHPNLFWALLGAGHGNFGIVTTFQFQLFDAADLNVTQIKLTYGVELSQQIFNAFQSWNYNNRNGNAYLGMLATQNSFTVKLIDADLSDADVNNFIVSFPTETLQPASIEYMSFIQVTMENAQFQTKKVSDLLRVSRIDVTKQGYKAKSYFSNKILNHAEILTLKLSLCSIPPSIFIQFGSFGGIVNRISKNETSFIHRDSFYLIQVGITPENEFTKEGLAQQKWIQEFENTVDILDNGESYQNYDDAELEDNFLTRYYGDNLRRLVDIKRRIDPDNYFRYKHSIPVHNCHLN